MGFPWGFSGNNLVKRLCKSLLKKKLGDLILGDIDLDQLDVQISKGTFHLSDLALNAEFINWKVRFLVYSRSFCRFLGFL